MQKNSMLTTGKIRSLDNFPSVAKYNQTTKLHPKTIIVQTALKNPPLKEIMIVPPLPQTIIPDRSLGSSNQSSSNRAISRLMEVPTKRRVKKDLEDEQVYSETSSEGELVGSGKFYTCAKYEEDPVTPDLMKTTERKDTKPKPEVNLFLDLQSLRTNVPREVAHKGVLMFSKNPLKMTPKQPNNGPDKPAELMEEILEKVKSVKSRNESMKKRLQAIHSFMKSPPSTSKNKSSKQTILGSFHTGPNIFPGSSASVTPSGIGSYNSLHQIKSKIHWVNKIQKGCAKCLTPVNEMILVSMQRASLHYFHLNDIFPFSTLEVPVNLHTADSKTLLQKGKTEVLLAAGSGLIKNYQGKVLYSGYVEFGKLSGRGTLHNTLAGESTIDHLCAFAEQMNPGLKDIYFLKRAKSFRSPWLTYEGEWRNNKMHGWGTIRYLSGAVFEGHFRNGWIMGLGTFTSGKLVVSGSWKENELMQVVPSHLDHRFSATYANDFPNKALSARPALQTFSDMREPQMRVEDTCYPFLRGPGTQQVFQTDLGYSGSQEEKYFTSPQPPKFHTPKPARASMDWGDFDEDFKELESFGDL